MIDPLCPECRDGKHVNCAGSALNVLDEVVPCTCSEGVCRCAPYCAKRQGHKGSHDWSYV